MRGNAIVRAERKRLGRIVIDEAIDYQRQIQAVDAGRVRACVAEFDREI